MQFRCRFYIGVRPRSKIKAEIECLRSANLDNIPELKDVVYDPGKAEFVTLEGRPFSASDFDGLVSQYASRTGSPYSLGSRTAKRAALFNTLLRKQSGEERKRILDKFGDQLSRGGLVPSLGGVMYSLSSKMLGAV